MSKTRLHECDDDRCCGVRDAIDSCARQRQGVVVQRRESKKWLPSVRQPVKRWIAFWLSAESTNFFAGVLFGIVMQQLNAVLTAGQALQ